MDLRWAFFVVALATGPLQAGDAAIRSWSNLSQLAPGQDVEIVQSGGATLRGHYVSSTDASIRLREDGHAADLEVPRAAVLRVNQRTAHSRRGIWIGLAVGAGAGAGIGAGAGAAVSNTSGGDFDALRGAIVGAGAAIGAVTGVVIGSLLSNRHSTVYRR